MKDSFVEHLLSANYYSLLTNANTNVSILEQEVIYVLFLSKNGELVVKFFSIQTSDDAHAEGLKKCIENALHSIGIVSMYQRLANLNVDSASVNSGIHRDLCVNMKESTPWTNIKHCFNHSLELAVKDTFDKTFLKEVDNMLLKLFYFYRKSLKV